VDQLITTAGRFLNRSHRRKLLVPPSSDDRTAEAVVFDNGHQLERAFRDLIEGLRCWPLWGSLAWQDIRQRYTRSIIGPFWLTLSMAILVVGFGFLYGKLFTMPLDTYLPYLAAGIVIWSFISTCLTDGCCTFFLSAPAIKQLAAPLSIYAYRVVWRNLIVFIHNAMVYVIVAAVFAIWPGWTNLFLILVALAIFSVNGLWASLLLGVFSARFRDIPSIVSSLIQVAFFMSPIFWHTDQLPARSAIVEYNPFAYYLDILREPLLGQNAAFSSWLVVLCLTVVGLVISFIVFARFRGRLSYWI